MNFEQRKQERRDYFYKWKYKNKLIECTACSGYRYYCGRPCGACNGTGKHRQREI